MVGGGTVIVVGAEVLIVEAAQCTFCTREFSLVLAGPEAGLCDRVVGGEPLDDIEKQEALLFLGQARDGPAQEGQCVDAGVLRVRLVDGDFVRVDRQGVERIITWPSDARAVAAPGHIDRDGGQKPRDGALDLTRGARLEVGAVELDPGVVGDVAGVVVVYALPQGDPVHPADV